MSSLLFPLGHCFGFVDPTSSTKAMDLLVVTIPARKVQRLLLPLIEEIYGNSNAKINASSPAMGCQIVPSTPEPGVQGLGREL